MSTTIKVDPAVRDRLRKRYPEMTASEAVNAALDAEERAAFLDSEAEAERNYNAWFEALDPERQAAIRRRDRDSDRWTEHASAS